MAVNKVQRADGTVELDVTGVTAESADVAAGKKFVNAAGELADGAMLSVTQATPSISVSSAGLITASATQEAGKVAAGTKSATKQLTVQGAKTVTPTTSEQVAVAAGVFTTGEIKVAAVSSYSERMAYRDGFNWIKASALYELYADIPNTVAGAYTLRQQVNAWGTDAVYNNPTSYPTATYKTAVTDTFNALDAYAASAGGGTESVVTGTLTYSSNTEIVISGLSFSKIKAVYLAAYGINASSYTLDPLSLILQDGKTWVYQYESGTNIQAYGPEGGTTLYSYTYSNGTLTITAPSYAAFDSPYWMYAIIGV